MKSVKYLVCKNGNKITIKRNNRNYDFGKVITMCDTLEKAKVRARLERLFLKNQRNKSVVHADEKGGKHDQH
jgi:hypothetical protein